MLNLSNSLQSIYSRKKNRGKKKIMIKNQPFIFPIMFCSLINIMTNECNIYIELTDQHGMYMIFTINKLSCRMECKSNT